MEARRFAAAGLNGVASTIVDLATLVGLAHLGIAVAVAAFCGCCTGAVTNYTLNKYVAFRDRTPVAAGQLARFTLVAVATGLLTAGGMELLAVHLGLPVVCAKTICAVVVFTLWSYPAQRRLVFSAPAYL
jgi:putative flippase GtrA